MFGKSKMRRRVLNVINARIERAEKAFEEKEESIDAELALNVEELQNRAERQKEEYLQDLVDGILGSGVRD